MLNHTEAIIISDSASIKKDYSNEKSDINIFLYHWV